MEAELSVGVVGAGQRAHTVVRSIDHPEVEITAVCDVDEERRLEAKRAFEAEVGYEEYDRLLADDIVDVVLLEVPQQKLAPMAVRALASETHVYSETPGAVTLEQASDIVEAFESSSAQYMLGENLIYFPENVLVRELVDAGLFGEPYYAEGEYIHDLKNTLVDRPWREEWEFGINGITYGTHQVGPILEWFGDDRIARVSCSGSGHHYTGPTGEEFELEDTTVMLCETEEGRLVKIRQDMISDRPYVNRLNSFHLQGTKGCYESPIGEDETDKLWLQDRATAGSAHEREFRELSTVESEYMPRRWREMPEWARYEGHYGAEYHMFNDFFDALIDGNRVPIDIEDSMDILLPCLMSQQAIGESEWTDVPTAGELA